MFGLFNQRQHIAHAQNPACHTVGVERLNLIQFLTHTGKLDGFPGHRPNRQGRAASGIAIQLTQQHTGYAQSLVKGGRSVDGILTGHGIHHQQDLCRFHRIPDGHQFLHQRLIDMQPAGGIQEHQILTVAFGIFDAVLGDLHRVSLSLLEHRQSQLTAHRFQLLDGRRTVHVAGHQQGIFTLAFHISCQFCAVGGLTCALQAHQHHNAWRFTGDIQFLAVTAHQGDQLFVDDLNDHLCRIQAFQNICAHCPFGDALDKVFHDFEVHVRLQQGQLDFPHGLFHICLFQPAFSGQLFKSRGEFFR